jgi:hypothetical protein
MPTANRYVGSALLPVEEGGTDSPLLDPTLTGLLAFTGHCIKAALDAKLAEMGGPGSSPITDACPVGHRFPWNHSGSFMREHDVGGGVLAVPLPGLWMWGGSSEFDAETSTLVHDAYRRTISLHYIFPQLSIPLGYMARSGLMPAVERTLRAAFSECYHPTYDGGQSVDLSLGLLRVQLLGIQCGEMAPVPRGSRARGAGSEGHEQKFFPAVQATLAVTERVGQWEADPVGDAIGDIAVELDHDTLPTLDRVLIDPEDLI